jgi:hypothetical protein
LAESWAEAASAVSAFRPSSEEKRFVEWNRCDPKAAVPFLQQNLYKHVRQVRYQAHILKVKTGVHDQPESMTFWFFQFLDPTF